MTKRLVLLVTLLLSLVGCRGRDGEAGAGSDTARTTISKPAEATTEETGVEPVEAVFARIPGIVRDVEPSVVAVLTNVGEGSGVVWRPEGLVLTNHHVVDGARSVELAFADGKRASAQVVATDPLTDLALLRADRQGLPAAAFADDLPVVGELAVAIGNPLGFENTVTAGIISGLHRSIPGSAPRTQALIDLVQTDAAISPGNSGGALVDGDGKVVGINVAYIPPQARAVSIGFAIPAPTIRPGDVIVAIGGKEIRSLESFLAELRGHDPGDRPEVGVIRDDQRLTVTVILAERPSA
ncbi:MAG: trypsin-like peptidase domain-containing protein [Actinomycetota bacterium]|nr:trypsin-like peptidase domain-containing protein [Actinomycetota bacterium]